MEINTQKNSALIKNILLVFAAVVLGGIAFLLSKQHLAQKEAEIIAKSQGAIEEKISVIVARIDIPVGAEAGKETLTVTETSSVHAPLDVLTPTEYDEIKGHIFLKSIPRGKPILRQYISQAIAERFSDLLAPGQRALTIAIDTINSNEGMLKTEDRVDLFLLSNSSVDVTAKKELIPLLQNVIIIATGKTPMVPFSNNGDPNQETDEQYQTITVAVLPQEAQKILLAKDSGSIVTLLRNRNDHNQLPASVMNYAELKNNNSQVQYFTGSAVEAGALKVQLQNINTIAPASEYPLQRWEKDVTAK
jgi:pilus assembly protein CpaB